MKVRRLLAATDGDLQALYDARQSDFRPRYYPVMQLLLRQDTAGIVEMARAVGVSQPAITQTLLEMRRSGLVESKAGRDRRSREVLLTSRGRDVARELAPLWAAAAQAAAGLDAELGTPLAELIERALAALEQRPFCLRVEDELRKEGSE